MLLYTLAAEFKVQSEKQKPLKDAEHQFVSPNTLTVSGGSAADSQ